MAPPAEASPRRFRVEVFDGAALDAAGWPSITAGPELLMYVYQSREFLQVWMDTIGKARRACCFLVTVRDADKRPILYLPLVIESRFNNRILRFMDGGVVDFNAPILSAGTTLSRTELAAVWSEIRALLPAFDLVDLQKIAGEVCGQLNPLAYLECGPYRSSGHALMLSDRGLPVSPSATRMRKKLKRQLQRLGERGRVEFVTGAAAARVPAVVDRLTALKRQQYLRTSSRDFFTSPGVRAFYARMATPELVGRISDLSALLCNGEVVSAHLGFKGRGRFYYVLPAFDIDYRPFAVGLLLLDHLVERCAAKQYTTFDLGEGDFAYKSKWATHRLPLLACEQAVTPIGALFGTLRRVRHSTAIDQLYGLCAGGLRPVRAE
jgi:CelD/BcsL family acetyltransferase involved in cellulose biosynthesis